MPYLKINYDDAKPTFEEIKLPQKSEAWLYAAYRMIGCRSIEVVRSVIRGIVLVIDEEGKLHADWQKRVNKVATVLYGSCCDVIVGNAILARVEGEDLVPLSNSDVERLQAYFPSYYVTTQERR